MFGSLMETSPANTARAAVTAAAAGRSLLLGEMSALVFAAEKLVFNWVLDTYVSSKKKS